MATQNDRILERLKQGPATNRELNEIGFRYSARIHELRRDGYDITWAPVKGKPSLIVYRLNMETENAA